jgi:YfiH family protein
MVNDFPVSVLAQLDEITVFQTAAFIDSTDIDSTNIDSTDINNADINSADVNSTELSTALNLTTAQTAQPSYGSLNLGLHVNDNAAQVLDNRMQLLAYINQYLDRQQRKPQGLPISSLHWVNQVHGQQIHAIDNSSLSMQPQNADAMVSQQAGLGLAIMSADCVPIVLYQPLTGQIAAIHAGWQGLACGVIQATAERFTAAGPIMAWVGVCISQRNYEVGRQVSDQLLAGCLTELSLTAAYLADFQQRYVLAVHSQAEPDAASAVESNKLHKTVAKLANFAKVEAYKVKLNLPKLALDQLITAGISVDTELPINCSYADSHYYSYRRQTHLQQPATGRMALVIVRHSLAKV